MTPNEARLTEALRDMTNRYEEECIALLDAFEELNEAIDMIRTLGDRPSRRTLAQRFHRAIR